MALPPIGTAQIPGVQGKAELQIRKIEVSKEYAAKASGKGADAMMQKDYESAFAYYKSAVDALPSGGDATAQARQNAMDGFSRAAVKLAEQRVSEGRFQDAETTVDVVLEERYNPTYPPALSLAAKLRDPNHFNKTVTPNFVAKVEDVKQLLLEADGFYQSGRYDMAFKRYEQVLNVDKFNIAARRGMDRVNQARSHYSDVAYNQARGDMLNHVEKAWELPVRKFDSSKNTIIEQPELDARGTNEINRKLDTIIFPTVGFTDATVDSAIEFIRKKSVDYDKTTQDPANRGINIVLKLDPDTQASVLSTPITIQLTDQSLRNVLDYLAKAANLKTKIEPYAVLIVPPTESTDILLTKEYKLPPGFLSSLPAASGGAAGGGAGAAAGAAAGGTTGKASVKEYLEQNGVQFPKNASANLIRSNNKLIVKNTRENLEVIDSIIDSYQNNADVQVEIETKFVEIQQNNLEELGFDWLLGQLTLAGGSGVSSSGGTAGYGQTITSAAGGSSTTPINALYPFVSGGLPIGATGASQGPVTGGNRSGSTAISANAVDALLFGTPAGPAPGILALAGVFTNPQFQVVLRALSQKKGIDLMSAPRVTTRNAETANIQIIREFRYPSQFDPPQIASGGSGSPFTPFTPSTPSAFVARNVGVELQVTPTVNADGYSIDLELRPKVTEFDGFINYGSPINASVYRIGADAAGFLFFSPSSVVQLSTNAINQPIFSVREVETYLTVYDSQTVVLGGLLREDVQKVQDKTPIIGDIPLVGRLFRSSSDQHIKRNLIVFVTPKLMDPAGQPKFKGDTEDEFSTTVDMLPASVGQPKSGIPNTP